MVGSLLYYSNYTQRSKYQCFFFSRSADIFQPFLETAEKTAGIFENFQPLVGAADERVDFFVK